MTKAKTKNEGKKPDLSRGFSLIEILVVLAMALVIAATAAPTMTNVVSTARMRGTMSNMSTYLQRARGDAIRSNSTKSVWTDISNGEWFVFSGTANNTEPAMTAADGIMPAGKQVVYVGTLTGANVPTALDTTQAFGTSTGITVHTTSPLSFNTRGMPCYWSSNTCDANSTGQAFVWYFVFQPPFGSNRWAALSVSPAGRIKNWYWDGAAWKN